MHTLSLPVIEGNIRTINRRGIIPDSDINCDRCARKGYNDTWCPYCPCSFVIEVRDSEFAGEESIEDTDLSFEDNDPIYVPCSSRNHIAIECPNAPEKVKESRTGDYKTCQYLFQEALPNSVRAYQQPNIIQNFRDKSKNSTLGPKLLIEGSVIAPGIPIERAKAAGIPATLLDVEVSCEPTTLWIVSSSISARTKGRKGSVEAGTFWVMEDSTKKVGVGIFVDHSSITCRSRLGAAPG